ncbi:MAG: helix-turn-helix domain-containing protein [Methylacidiphilales bacterium]|nr:helix-turn-helix domain-containing protein [Candidatus Methylacidiphilales bacterium]NJR14533.1 helix-turn-helix domain-containing protein [Calothrix sp. CSU_2_0]
MYQSVTELAKNLGVSTSRIRFLINTGRIKGAFKVGEIWVIPLVDGKPQASKGSRGPELTWNKCRPGLVSKIHVNQNVIRENNKTGAREPVISVKNYKGNDYGHEVIIHGCCRVVYQPDSPLDCGAKVWIETYSRVEHINKNKNSQKVVI